MVAGSSAARVGFRSDTSAYLSMNSTPATVARLANMRLLPALYAAIRQVSFLLSGHWYT
jgi:hypothetical protein